MHETSLEKNVNSNERPLSGSFDKDGKQSGFFSRDGETLYEAVAKSGYLPHDNNDVQSPFLESNEL